MENRVLQCYKLHCEPVKAIFQDEYLYICYLCKTLIEKAEIFIQTVLNNQILLENIRNISDKAIENQVHPIHNLSIVPLDAIEISGNEKQIAESISIYKQGVYRDCSVKEELKFEDDDLPDNGGNDFTNDIDFNNDVKEEDCNLKSLKTELDAENFDTLKRDIKKTKVRKKSGKTRKSGAFKIELFHITRAQCMDELARKATEKVYLSAPYKCELCVKGFTFKPTYDKHMELHSKEMGDYECDVCKQRMDSKERLTSHRRYHEVRYKCLDCGLVRINKCTILDHYTAHHASGAEFMCRLCHKSFKRRLSLRKHMSYMHNNRGRVICAYCVKTYANKEVLKSHMMTKHPKEVSAVESKLKWICQDCGKGFKAPSQLKLHSAKHSLERGFYCVECDKSFKTESGLKQHLKIAMPHVNYKDLPLPCSHCEKRFAIRRDLERHVNRMHLNIKPFNCDKCDKAYLNNWTLKQHKRAAHEGYKRPLSFPCPMCDKVFDRKCTLKGHIRTHTGERPYQCNKCPAKFNQSGILSTHMKLIHLKLTRDGRPKPSLK
ncbi:unnamed protein product, partial [Iphiclides podalirius]